MDQIAILHRTPEIFITGDININYADRSNSDGKKLVKFLHKNNLSCSDLEPTHDAGGVLDLVITNRPEIKQNQQIIHLRLSDHSMPVFTQKLLNPKIPKKHITARTFKRFDEAEFKNEVDILDLEMFLSLTNIDEIWELFVSEVNQIADKYAPYKRMTARVSNERWVTDDYISAGHDRDHYTKRWRRLRKLDDKIKMRAFRNIANNMANGLKTDYYKTEIDKNQHDPKKLWKLLRDFLPSHKSNSHIPSGDKDMSAKDLANLFNITFCEVGSKLADQLPAPSNDYVAPQIIGGLDPLIITAPSIEEIRKTIASLPVHKSTGIEGLNSRLIKPISEKLAIILHYIYKLSISQAYIPKSWKVTTVTPLFKDGDRTIPTNYRPISVIALPLKILERTVHDQIYEYTQKYDLITPFQSGFRPQHSTQTATTDLVDNILLNMDKGMATALAFLDLRKAFDTVDRKLLLHKLSRMLKSKITISWLEAYLSDRGQKTKVNSTISDISSIQVGVPQGSILGPLLFLLYMNDLPKVVKLCNIALYADDTAIYVHGENNELLEHRLQSDLNEISEWLLANKLSINAQKCKILRISTRQHRTRPQPLEININNVQLEQVTYYKYLGYWLDDTLCFSQHIQKLVDKINKRLYLIKQSSKFLPRQESLRLYKCLILPVFDYGDTLYMNASQNNLQTLQVLQNKFAKTILKVDCFTSTS